MSSPAAMSDSVQMNFKSNNFNPSWMPQSAPSATVTKNDRVNNRRLSITEEDENPCDPIFAKHSYGREDLLALNKVDSKMPDGMEKCIFSMEKAQTPIILLPLTEIELRLQHNINSSKAMSTLNKQDRDRLQSLNGGAPEYSGRGVSGSDHGGGGWTVAGGAGTTHNQTGGRTSSFTTVKKQVQQPQTSGQQPALSNRWSALNSSGVGGPVSARPWKSNNDRSKEKPAANTSDSERDAIVNKNSPADEPAAQVSNLLRTSSLNDPQIEPPIEAALQSSNGHSQIKAQKQDQQQQSQNNIHITTIRASPPSSAIPEKWHYLDPNGVQRGPFDSQQMQAWFSSGYFNNDLRLCRVNDTSYTTLGDLVTINGATTPFVIKAPTPPVQQVEIPIQMTNDTQPTSRRTDPPSGAILGTSGISPRLVDVEKIWANNPLAEEAANAALINNIPFVSSSIGGPGSTAFSAFSPYTNHKENELEKVLKEKERQIFEEQVKLREKEEILRREEQEREEKKRQMFEMEVQLQRQKEEMDKKQREREIEMETRRMQIAEYERKRKEELEMLEQKIKAEHYQQKMRKEEDERKRTRELEELIRREQDRQRQIFEAEVKRKREEEETRLRMAFQEAQRLQAAALESARRAEEEQRLRLIEDQRKQQQANEEAKRQRELAKAEERRKVEAEIQREKAYAQSIKVSGWASTPVQPPSGNIWSQPSDDSFTQVSKHKQPSPPVQLSQQPRTWSSIPTTQPAPIPKPPSKQPSQPPKPKANKQQSKPKAILNPQEKKEADKFTLWIIKRVKELNSTVDAEVFASFIEGIESPNEAEDYIIGYLGESKAVKDFHREFLTKRIELRPRVKATEKDDLSGPAAALNDALDKTSTSNPAPSGGNGAAKKKKPKAQKVLDPRSLGFRPSGDPNRINAGELDTAPPVPLNNRKR